MDLFFKALILFTAMVFCVTQVPCPATAGTTAPKASNKPIVCATVEEPMGERAHTGSAKKKKNWVWYALGGLVVIAAVAAAGSGGGSDSGASASDGGTSSDDGGISGSW